MPDLDEHDGTYTSTVTELSPDPSGTLTIQKSGGPTTYSYTPTSTGVSQAFTPNKHGQTLTFSLDINGTTYNFNGSFTSAHGGNGKSYSGSVNDNSPKAQIGTWQATATAPMPMHDREPRKAS